MPRAKLPAIDRTYSVRSLMRRAVRVAHSGVSADEEPHEATRSSPQPESIVTAAIWAADLAAHGVPAGRLEVNDHLTVELVANRVRILEFDGAPNRPLW